MRLLLPLLALITLRAYASEPCYRIKDCIETAADITGQQYFYNDSDIEKNIKVIGLKIDNENVDQLISKLLFSNDLARVKTAKGYQVMSTKNIRNYPVSLYEGEIDKIPETHDYYMAAIPVKYIKASDINKTFRSFMSASGRIIPIEYASRILIMDNAINIKRLSNLIKLIDIPKNQRKKKKG